MALLNGIPGFFGWTSTGSKNPSWYTDFRTHEDRLKGMAQILQRAVEWMGLYGDKLNEVVETINTKIDPTSGGVIGPQGPQGIQGPEGPQGIQGVMGPQGPQGVGAEGESAFELAVENGYTGTLADWLNSLHGVAGPQGIQGPTGPQGTPGTTGPQGIQGPIGNTGPEGPMGPKGDTGATGPQGAAAPVTELSGAGSPNGVVTATIGVTYTDTTAYKGAVRWVKTTASGNTGWKVQYGDTGMIAAAFTLRTGYSSNANAASVRRTASSVQASITGLSVTTASTSNLIASLPAGYYSYAQNSLMAPQYFPIVSSVDGSVLGYAYCTGNSIFLKNWVSGSTSFSNGILFVTFNADDSIYPWVP